MHYLLILILFSSLCSELVSATSQAEQPIKLESVEAKSVGNITLLTLDLDSSPSWKNVEMQAQDSYVEFNLPTTLPSASVELIDNIVSPYVLKVLPIKHSDTALALRMYVSEQGQIVQRATTAEIAGKQIFISIDHRKLEEILTSIKLSNSRETVKHAGFAEMIRHIGIALATAMGMLLFLLIGMRWMVRDRTNQSHHASCPMKIIWRLKIAPKHRLLLVEVYGQMMLFASDARGITLLSDSPYPATTPPLPKADNRSDVLLNQTDLEAQKSIQKQTNLVSSATAQQPQTGIEDMANIIHRKLSNI